MRISGRVLVLTVASVSLVQLVLWLGFGRHRIRAVAFERDLALSEQVVASGSYPADVETSRFIVLCSELTEELQKSQVGAAQERLARIYKDIGTIPVRLATETAWVERQSNLVDQQVVWLNELYADGWCATPRINTPLLATVDCSDGLGEISWHGHSHAFVYVLGLWLPVWDGGEWVS